MRPFPFPKVMFAVAGLVAACLLPVASPAHAQEGTAREKISIVAAESFYGDLAAQIGGDRVTVTSILSNPDDDPHLFEASPSTARALSKAAIVIYNGAGYDPWMDKLLSASSAPARKAIVAADFAGYREGDNPHLWYSPSTLPAMARALAEELEKRDGAHAATFRGNLAKFNTSFAEVTNRIEAIRSRYHGVQVSATEPVFGYMAQALGLKMLNNEFQMATMNDTDPSPSQVAGFEKSLKDGSVRILFYNSQVTDETTKRLLEIARNNKVVVIGVTETMPAGRNIQSWFGGQLNEIGQALSGLTQ